MKRLLSIIVLVVIVVAGVGGYSVLKQNLAKPAEGENSDSRVLGATQQSIESFIGNVQPTVNQVVSAVSTNVSAIADKVLVDDQKIQVDKAFNDIKSSAANIPEHVFNEAKYNYCKQVVADHDASR